MEASLFGRDRVCAGTMPATVPAHTLIGSAAVYRVTAALTSPINRRVVGTLRNARVPHQLSFFNVPDDSHVRMLVDQPDPHRAEEYFLDTLRGLRIYVDPERLLVEPFVDPRVSFLPPRGRRERYLLTSQRPYPFTLQEAGHILHDLGFHGLTPKVDGLHGRRVEGEGYVLVDLTFRTRGQVHLSLSRVRGTVRSPIYINLRAATVQHLHDMLSSPYASGTAEG